MRMIPSRGLDLRLGRDMEEEGGRLLVLLEGEGEGDIAESIMHQRCLRPRRWRCPLHRSRRLR